MKLALPPAIPDVTAMSAGDEVKFPGAARSRPYVVLDKNILQGASRSAIAELFLSYRPAMPGPLFYELLTTSARARRRCFSVLPHTDDPVALIDHVGILMKQEVASGAPSGKPSAHQIDIRFRFNARLQDDDYCLPEQAQATIDDLTQQIESDIERLLFLADGTADLFPNLLVGTTEAQRASCEDAQAAIATPKALLLFYRNMRAADKAKMYPAIDDGPEAWATFRWLQVLMLFATDLYIRYRGRIRECLSADVRRRLEHDVHDAQILVLGILEGALATREKKLQRWHFLLTGRNAIVL